MTIFLLIIFGLFLIGLFHNATRTVLAAITGDYGKAAINLISTIIGVIVVILIWVLGLRDRLTGKD